MTTQNVYRFRLATVVEFYAEDVKTAHSELYRGLNTLHQDFGISEYRVELYEIWDEDGNALFNSNIDFEDSDFDIQQN